MTGDKNFDSRRMFKHACAFVECALFCAKEPENIVIGKTELIKPMIVNSAFGCEVFLKSVLIYNGLSVDDIKKCGHTLFDLWRNVEENDISFAHKIEEDYLKDFHTDDLTNFKSFLESTSKAFETWRYIYERTGASINVKFLNWLTEKLRENCCQKYYKMSWDIYASRG